VSAPPRPEPPVVPAHVPPALVCPFSFWTSPGMQSAPGGDPHAALAPLRELPPVFWAPQNTFDGQGTWMLTRAEDMRSVLQDAATFSSARQFFSPLVGGSWPLIPLEIDPPDHTKFRALINPLFSPKRMNAMLGGIRERAATMIETLKSRGSCSFMDEFAFPFAVGIFLQFLGIPDTRLQEFVAWGNQLLHAPRARDRRAAAHSIIGFLEELFERRRREPADDIATMLIQARVDDRALTPDELRGYGVLLFVAGLDTVANALGFDFRYLAQHPDEQQRLRANPELIPNAAEEMLRAYSTVHMVRVATRDARLHGVDIKAGDRVTCSSLVANRDPTEFADPDRIDFEREVNRHVAFSYGPHRCAGSHLARREVVAALTEWLARMPPFRIQAGTAPVPIAGTVFGLESLHLEWH
jgi:cytochrome P450